MALSLIIAPILRAQDDGSLNIADLSAYRAALEPPKTGEPPPRPAVFRDLWDRPAEFRGRRVAVGGQVERVFHKGPIGEFPALAEVWVVDSAKDPLCLIAPEPAPKPGDSVRFEGTFLRRIRYRGGDTDRLAPLIVGPGPPRVERAAENGAVAGRAPFEGMLVAVLGGMVVLVAPPQALPPRSAMAAGSSEEAAAGVPGWAAEPGKIRRVRHADRPLIKAIARRRSAWRTLRGTPVPKARSELGHTPLTDPRSLAVSLAINGVLSCSGRR